MDIAFDTLAASRKLHESGMPREQSEATAGVVAGAVSGLVTRDFLETTLDRRFAAVDTRFNRVDARFTKIDTRFNEIDARFNEIDARFTGIDGRFTGIEGRFTELQAQMDKRFSEQTVRFVAIQVALMGTLFAALRFIP